MNSTSQQTAITASPFLLILPYSICSVTGNEMEFIKPIHKMNNNEKDRKIKRNYSDVLNSLQII